MRVKVIGQMDNTQDHTLESANRVYDIQGLAPTIPTCGGGGIQPKILVNQENRGGYETTEIICSLALNASERFSLFNMDMFKCIKANNDLGILERVCKYEDTL